MRRYIVDLSVVAKAEEIELTGTAAVCYSNDMNRRSNTLDRLVDPLVRTFTPEVARALVRLRADPKQQARMTELAEKCTEGQLTSEEREEYETSVRFANYLAIIQAKARRLLRDAELA